MVDDTSIVRLLDQHADSGAAAQSLLEEALNRGGKRDITIIVARYEIPDQGASGRQTISEQKSMLDSSAETRVIPDAYDSAND
jgi:hypothetical protein